MFGTLGLTLSHHHIGLLFIYTVNTTIDRSKNPLLWHLVMYAFPEGQPPVVVSRNEEVFQLLSSACCNAELKKVSNLQIKILIEVIPKPIFALE